MSEQNVEIVRNIHDLWNARESASHLIDPDLEYVNPSYAVESGVRRGRGMLAKILEVYPDFTVEIDRLLDAGDEVAVLATVTGTSASGFEVERRQGYVWTIRAGKAVRFCWFNDPAEALEAIGVSE